MASEGNAKSDSSFVDRWVARAVNGLEVARYGGLRTDKDPAPYDVVAHESVYRLRHYFPNAAGGQPMLLIPPLMQVADVWDISPETSAVRQLADAGIDPWVVDFGDPEEEPGGTSRNFSDHVLAVVEAIGRVKDATGTDVHLGGYSQGGVFCYVAAAYRGNQDVASIFVLGSPIESLDVDGVVPEGLFWDAVLLQSKLLAKTGLPKWAVAPMFNWSNPVKTVKNDLDFLMALNDRESLLPREPQRQFLKEGAWIGWSGPAIEEMITMLSKNSFVDGGVLIGDHTVGLADLTVPILIVVGEADTFAPPPMVRRIVEAAPKAEVYECVLPVGHFGLPVSSHARAKTWPGVVAWVGWTQGEATLPDYIHHLSVADLDADAEPDTGGGLLAKAAYALGTAAQAGLAVPRTAVESGKQLASTAWELSVEAAEQLPRLIRLERMGPLTRVSYAAMLEDAASSRPDEVAFLHRDRAHTSSASNKRIDRVVAGLISVGIRRGEHVGVLTDMRPSALAAVAALNRIGAVAVMLRPGQDTRSEARLGQARKVIADPEHADAAFTAGLDVFVLGGGGGARQLSAGVVDLEQVDPKAVRIPKWYQPNPGRARDLAFVLFSGHGDGLRADRISNGRWAKSALAAATAAALTPKDTIYSLNPLYHPSGLLLTTAATVASGARLALSDGFDPQRFWREVRRYGVTVVPYTWTMLHALVVQPDQREERNHPVRLFVGSGMPANLWRRVATRFGANVLELYASTRSDAMLGNVPGRKIGSGGLPLPGTPEVRVVAYEPGSGVPHTGTDGYAVPSGVGEIGLLMVRASPADLVNGQAVRGLFTAEDAWMSSGDLFRVDRDGDLWFVDSFGALIPTARGIVSPHSVETALGELEAVDLAACYRHDRGGQPPSAVAAVTLRDGKKLDTASVNRALQELAVGERPDVVRVVPSMPLTSWFRPSVAELQAQTIGTARVWRLNHEKGRYQR